MKFRPGTKVRVVLEPPIWFGETPTEGVVSEAHTQKFEDLGLVVVDFDGNTVTLGDRHVEVAQ